MIIIIIIIIMIIVVAVVVSVCLCVVCMGVCVCVCMCVNEWFVSDQCTQAIIADPYLTVTGQYPVMTGTLLYVLGSCEHHCEPTKQMCISLRPTPTGDTLWLFVYPGQLTETGRPKCT